MTRGQYERFLTESWGLLTRVKYLETVADYSPTADCPALGVSWYDAAEYCNWLSKRENIPEEQWCFEVYDSDESGRGFRIKKDYINLRGYRLPTEGEWEFACLAGAQAGRSYGDADTLLSEYAHYDANSSKRSWPVGQLKPNAFGLFDMYGNAMEWCASRYGPYNVDREEGAASERKSLLDTVEEGEVLPKSSRVLRGGWFGSSDMLIRSADRGYSQPVSTGKYTGFRLTRTVLD